MKDKVKDFFKDVHRGSAPASFEVVDGLDSRNFAEYIFWRSLKEYLPKDRRMKVLEVGSAPGKNLIRLHRIFGYIPYGIDNSESGVMINRAYFEKNGLHKDNIIYGDFFDKRFHQRYKDYFNICFSYGFLEHFDDSDYVMEQHIDVLKKGGILVIAIPNFRYINYLLLSIFSPSTIGIHNRKIMNIPSFNKLFHRKMEPLFCGYQGGFNLGLFYTRKNTVRRKILKSCKRWVQSPANRILFWMHNRNLNVDCRFLSPYLVYIGRKV